MQTKRVVKDIENLKSGTSKVISDLNGMTSELTANATSSINNAAETLQVQAAEELERIRASLSDLTNLLGAGVKKADHNIRENPYAWVIGALGVGVVLSALSWLRKPSH